MNFFEKLIEYKIKPARRLIRDGKLFFLLGVLIEKTVDKNPHLWYLHKCGEGTVVDADICGHQMLLDLSDRGISRKLYTEGVHEKEPSRVYISELKRICSGANETVNIIEVGANIGYYVLKEAEVAGEVGRIHAFEPSQSNCELLKKNVDLNGYADIVNVVPKAIGDRNGTARFAVSEQSNRNTIEAEEENRGDLIGAVDVEMTTLESYLDTLGISANEIGAIRMDLEGYETVVIESIKDIFQSSEEVVAYVEVHPEDIGESELKNIIDILDSCGFNLVYAHQHRREIEIDELSQVLDVGGSHIHLIMTKDNN